MTHLEACYFCGTVGESLARHQVVPESLSPRASEQRTVALCPRCHGKLETVTAPLVDRLEAAADDRGGGSSGAGVGRPAPAAGSAPQELEPRRVDRAGESGGETGGDAAPAGGDPAEGDSAGGEPTAEPEPSPPRAAGSTARSTPANAGATESTASSTEATASSTESTASSTEATASSTRLGPRGRGDAGGDSGESVGVDDAAVSGEDPMDAGGGADATAPGTSTGNDPEPVATGSDPAGAPAGDSVGSVERDAGADVDDASGADAGGADAGTRVDAGGADTSGADAGGADADAARREETGSGVEAAGGATDGDDGDGGGESAGPSDPAASTAHRRTERPDGYRKVLRLLSNRDLPIDRADFESLASSAYGMELRECRAVIDHAIGEGILVDEDGRLRRA